MQRIEPEGLMHVRCSSRAENRRFLEFLSKEGYVSSAGRRMDPGDFRPISICLNDAGPLPVTCYTLDRQIRTITRHTTSSFAKVLFTRDLIISAEEYFDDNWIAYGGLSLLPFLVHPF